jgi:CubicO group peptidase (beta-lactamase class C family)
MNQRSVSRAAALLRESVDARVFPAAVAEVGSADDVLWRERFGRLSFDDDAPAVQVDTIFDLASLTKPLATAAVVLDLAARGDVRLEDPVSRFFPEWSGADREPATIRHLLEHAAGLSPRLLDRPPHDRRAFEHDICTMPLEYAPGTRSLYTDLGYILLGFCAEQRGRGALPDQAIDLLMRAVDADGVLGEVGLFARVSHDLLARTAPTVPLPDDARRGRRLIGEVHDNYAALLGGFAGHAGLFGTAIGVGRIARTLLRSLRGDVSPVAAFSPDVVKGAIRKSTVPGSSRAIGWDTMLPTSSCGTQLSPEAFGHVGFTGTSLWIDPVRDRYFVLLTNRVCDGGTSEQMQHVRRAFHDALASI